MPNEEDLIFLVGCTDIGAGGGGESELFAGFPNSYNKIASARQRLIACYTQKKHQNNSCG